MPEIRSAREEDLPDLVRIGRESGLDVKEEMILKSFQDPARRLILAENEGETLGYAEILLTGCEAEIVDIAVFERARSKGVGEALIRSVQEKLKEQEKTEPDFPAKIFLEVAEANRPARHLYEKTGFESVGRRKNYYPDHQDAIVMCWSEDAGTQD